MCALNGPLGLCFIAVTLSNEPARCTQLIIGYEGEFNVSFCKVAVVTSPDAVGVIVGHGLTLLAGKRNMPRVSLAKASAPRL